ncbi:hypothetical protein COU59_01175 [Candidatus Pacearchaeota archaeon CG10_big_fil_rev_8_21_14_0_10_34_12]|nr:MAG: hypothetical protein COU59_01175 [Candidatus Pacearchaeota archaeon CG10_big_fil_rev_8_21_14_0_10_34_12]
MKKGASENSIRGKKSRAAGSRFERKVRDDLEKQKWVVDKWSNNVDIETEKVVKSRRKYNPFSKALIIGTGFPDFIALKPSGKKYEVIGIEVKGNGWLDKTEREKCNILLDKKIFGKVLIAKKGKKRGKIEYIDFKRKYKKT